MAFDTRETLDALSPPTFTHDGVTYVGRHLSILEWMREMEALGKLGRNELNVLEVERLYRRLCDKLFPPQRRSLWQWLTRTPKPLRVSGIVLSLPLEIQHRAMTDFLRSQARAHGLLPTSPTLGKTGT